MSDEKKKITDGDGGMSDSYITAWESSAEASGKTESETVSKAPEKENGSDEKILRKKNKVEVRFAVIILAIVALILLVFRINSAYDIRLTRGERGIRFSVNPKNAGESSEWGENMQGTMPYDAMYSWYSWGTPQGTESDAEHGDHKWDGLSLNISGEVAHMPLTLTQIYEKAAASSVIVKTTDSNAVTYVGAGTVMTQDGYIITNAHLLSVASDIKVTIGDKDYSAEVVGLDNITDIAVIKVDASGLEPAEFADSSGVLAGESVAVIGNPVGDNINITNAVIASIDSDFTYLGMTTGIMQVYAYLGMNASGSMVLNQYGQVVGLVNTLFYWLYPEAAGMSFAVPISEVKPIVDELLKYGYIKGRPDSGIITSDIPPVAAAYYGYPAGVYVTDVDEKSAAFAAGVRRGDLIVEANGLAIETTNELYALINSMNAGDDLTLYLYRSKDTGYITFKLSEATR